MLVPVRVVYTQNENNTKISIVELWIVSREEIQVSIRPAIQ